jgi:hypothetical protein
MFTKRRAIAAATAVMAGGCHPGLNEGVSPGETPLTAYAEPVTEGPTDERSLTAGHDRSHWAGWTVSVPVGRTEHPPRYAAWGRSESPPAATAAFPTADSALDLNDETPRPVGESFVRIALGYGQMIGIPIEMFVTPPTTVQRGPAGTFARMSTTEDGMPVRRWCEPVGRPLPLDAPADGDDGSPAP